MFITNPTSYPTNIIIMRKFVRVDICMDVSCMLLFHAKLLKESDGIWPRSRL